MKKLLCILLALIAVLCLAACGNADIPNDHDDDDGVEADHDTAGASDIDALGRKYATACGKADVNRMYALVHPTELEYAADQEGFDSVEEMIAEHKELMQERLEETDLSISYKRDLHMDKDDQNTVKHFYSEQMGLEVEEVREVWFDMTSMVDGKREEVENSICAVQIDGQWYLAYYSFDQMKNINIWESFDGIQMDFDASEWMQKIQIDTDLIYGSDDAEDDEDDEDESGYEFARPSINIESFADILERAEELQP